MTDPTNDPSASGSRWEPTEPPTESPAGPPSGPPEQAETGPINAVPADTASTDDTAQFAVVGRAERVRTTAASGGRWARARKGLLGGAAALIMLGGTAGFAIGQATSGDGDRADITPVNFESGVDGDQSEIPDGEELDGTGGRPGPGGRGGPGGPMQGDPELGGDGLSDELDSVPSGGADDPGTTT